MNLSVANRCKSTSESGGPTRLSSVIWLRARLMTGALARRDCRSRSGGIDADPSATPWLISPRGVSSARHSTYSGFRAATARAVNWRKPMSQRLAPELRRYL